MTFWGHSFAFDGTPCEAFDLMMYDFGSASDDGVSIAGTPTIVEDVINTRYKPLHYGVTYEQKNTVTLTFGVNQRRLDEDKYLDRYEVDEISSWLTGHDQYKKLEIQQDDMIYVWYNVIATSIQFTTFRSVQWAMQVTFTCDSPYGYMYPQEYEVTLGSSTATLDIYNESSMNSWYKPMITITGGNGSEVTITNTDDTNLAGAARAFTMTVPAGTVTIDCENLVLTSSNGINLYANCSTLTKFPRLRRGRNRITISGNSGMVVKFTCTYPVNIGG